MLKSANVAGWFVFFALNLTPGCSDAESSASDAPASRPPPTVDEDPGLEALELSATRVHVRELGNPAGDVIIVLHGGPGDDYRSLAAAGRARRWRQPRRRPPARLLGSTRHWSVPSPRPGRALTRGVCARSRRPRRLLFTRCARVSARSLLGRDVSFPSTRRSCRLDRWALLENDNIGPRLRCVRATGAMPRTQSAVPAG